MTTDENALGAPPGVGTDGPTADNGRGRSSAATGLPDDQAGTDETEPADPEPTDTEPTETGPDDQAGPDDEAGTDEPASERSGPVAIALRGYDAVADWVFDHVPEILVGAAMLWYFWYYRGLTIGVHEGYGTSAFDIGVFDQGTWLLSQFKAPFVTVTGRNLFADHSSFVLLLVAPVYWLFPGPTTLLTLQAGALALAAIPIYMVGKKRIGGVMAAALAVAFLLQPALGASNLENFHPDAFSTLFVAILLYAAIEDKRVLFIVAAILTLSVKEDAVLVVLPIALWFAWRRDRKLGGIMAVASVAYTLLSLKMIRTLNNNLDLQSWRIPFGGPTGTVKTALRQPGDVVEHLRADNRPWYVWQLLAPTGFVFLVSPEIAATGILVLTSNTMSTFVYQHLIGYHYVMPLVPILAMGTVWAVSRLKTHKRRVIAVAIVMVCSLWTSYLWTQTSWSRNGAIGHWELNSIAVQQIEEIRRQVPDDAVVTSYHSFAPHVTHRDRLYMWPVPWRAVYWGQLNKEGEQLPFTDEIEYLFLPTTLAPEDQQLFDGFKDQFEVVASNNTATLYKRKGMTTAGSGP